MQKTAPPFIPRPLLVPDLGPDALRPRRRPVRAALQLALVAVWTPVCALVQAALIRLPGRAKIAFAAFFWRTICQILAMRVVVSGTLPTGNRPVVFIANHCSWLDIPVLGGSLRGCFVSRADVAQWPVMGTVARLGRTVFVSRARSGTGRELENMRARLQAGDNLILFPEGTSSDGARVLPFRSAFFNLALGDNPPLLQPVSVAYDRHGYLPALRAARPIFGWYGDMELQPHVWQLLGRRGLRARVHLHATLDPAGFESRQALAAHCWQIVADGAAALRQQRVPDTQRHSA